VALISQALAGGGDLAKQGAQFAIAGSLPGEQTSASLVMGSKTGLIVWKDNGVDGDGSGIAATSVESGRVASQSPLLVNEAVAGDQEFPAAAVLSNGNILVAWRNGAEQNGTISGRVLGSSGQPIGHEFQISEAGAPDCLIPSVAALADGTAVVAWGQRESGAVHQDVYFQRVSATGAKLGNATLANQYYDLNQRNPSVTALKSGGFAIGWVSEEQRSRDSVDIFARLFQANGAPVTDEFALNTGTRVCDQPVLAGLADGGLVAAWADISTAEPAPNWDVRTRSFNASGVARNSAVGVNTQIKGRQMRPRVAVTAAGPLVVWSSLGQDGWGEGVFSRRLDASGNPSGDEVQVNSAWEGNQIEPSVASDGSDAAVVVWSSYVAGSSGTDLQAQVLGSSASALAVMPPPTVFSTTPTRFIATWPVPDGVQVAKYEVIVDDSGSPEVTANNFWSSKAVLPGSTHSVKISYQLADGRKSTASAAAQVTTWGEDLNGDGLPDDWQNFYFGVDETTWPAATVDSDGDGMTDRAEFMVGTNPRNAASRFSLHVQAGNAGHDLVWSTRPGFLYQLQRSPDLKTWENLGGGRVAPADEDATAIVDTTSTGFYRVIRVR